MNYGNYLKQKIENERERQYLKMKQRMKPEIYQKSKGKPFSDPFEIFVFHKSDKSLKIQKYD